MKNVKRSERRHLNDVKQNKKYNIIKHCLGDYLSNTEDEVFKKQYGKLVKGKVHCSCWMCSTKTKKDGIKHSEKKKILRESDN